MASIYIAAQYAKRETVKFFARRLREAGHFVTAHWLNESLPPNVKMSDVSREELKGFALSDLRDIEDADTLIFYAEPQESQPPRGGRHVEFGYALRGGAKIVVIGEEENVFHLVPGVVHVASEDEALRVLR